MKWIVGIDEAGRGPLAGPVAVGVVKASEDFDFLTIFPGLNDSKKLSEKKREALFALLEEQTKLGTIMYRVELPSSEAIDSTGISVVIREAIAKSLEILVPKDLAGKVWLDGSLSAPTGYQQETVIGGDALIPAIMLASIAAKVTRDRLMVNLAREYPQYGFEKHKGYGTKHHLAIIREHGVCAIHRRTFIHLDHNSGEV